MSWLARLFQDIGDLFYWVYYYVARAGMWIEDNIGWSGLANIFYDIAYYFGDIWPLCYDIADELDAWWGKITETASDISNLIGFVLSIVAWIKGIPAEIAAWGEGLISDVVVWVKSVPDEIRVWGEGLIIDVKAWVNEKYADIAAWVEAHALDIYNAIKGYLTDIAAWVTAHSFDLWLAIKDHLVTAIGIQLALIAAPINLVNLWFDSIQGFFNDPWGWLEAQFETWFDKNW